MILKILVFFLVLFTFYIVFFKLKRSKTDLGRKKIDADTMVECTKCNTFVSTKEAILKNGKYYCSKNCTKD